MKSPSRWGLKAWALAFLLASPASAQTDWGALERTAGALRDRALADRTAYSIVETLTRSYSPRPAGSATYRRGTDWAASWLKSAGFDKVYTERYPLRVWRRGAESAVVTSAAGRRLAIAAFGGSVPTAPGGLEAEVVLFKSFESMAVAPPEAIRGRIAVVTQPMSATRGPEGYFALRPVRSQGATEAAKKGAVAFLLRSLATGEGRAPHTGGMRYAEGVPQIPTAALSIPSADLLETLAAKGPVRIRLKLASSMAEVEGRTVIGELTGRERPDEIVLVGAHIDTWDNTPGAMDDASGVAEVMAAGRLIARLPRRPRRTLRVALFGAEETGGSAAPYAAAHLAEQPRHVIAAEADSGGDAVTHVELPAGGFASPYGRSLNRVLTPLAGASAPPLLSSRPTSDFGADLSRLQDVPLALVQQDLTRYFDVHHSGDDTLDRIDRRQLNQATAVWTVFTYLAADSDIDFRAAAK